MKNGEASGRPAIPESARVAWRLVAEGTGFPSPAQLQRERPDAPPVRGTFRICGIAAVEDSTVQPS